MQRILVIKMSSLGDLFHALPAVRLIKAQTGATIDWVAHDIYVDLVRCFRDVNRVIPFPRGAVLRHLSTLRAALRETEYDLILDFQGLLKSAFVAKLAKGVRVVGPSFHREGSRLFYDEVAGPRNKERHAVDECLDVVRHLGLKDAPVEFPVEFPPAAADLPAGDVALLPCSRRADKNWTVDGFVEVGRALVALGARPVLVGGKADATTCDHIVAGIGAPAVSAAGRTTMVQLGGLLRTMKMMVTVDSGPMHVAAALGVPVVAVFGPTFPLRTGPFGSRHIVVQQGRDLTALPPAPVVEAATRLYNSVSRGVSS